MYINSLSNLNTYNNSELVFKLSTVIIYFLNQYHISNVNIAFYLKSRLY